MATYHIIFTQKDGSIKAKDKNFKSFVAVENWLNSIGSTYWEIGMSEKDYREYRKRTK